MHEHKYGPKCWASLGLISLLVKRRQRVYAGRSRSGVGMVQLQPSGSLRSPRVRVRLRMASVSDRTPVVRNLVPGTKNPQL